MKLIEETRPAQATLVPDGPDVLTSNAGWDTIKYEDLLKKICKQLSEWGVRSSIFVDTNPKNIEGAKKVGVDRIELYTGPYADNYEEDRDAAIKDYVKAAELAHELGLGINAGHDLSLDNLAFFKQNIQNLDEVSIGHALIADALYLGLETTIKKYLELLK